MEKARPWPPLGAGPADRLRVERGDHLIGEEHLADSIELLMEIRDRPL